MHMIVWEFRVRPEHEAEFTRAYGPSGEWARLFQADPAWRGSELLRDPATPQRYLTIDRWESAAAYHAFRERSRDAYAALDRRFEALTVEEAKIGEFEA